MRSKARSQFQEGEAQPLGDANKLFLPCWHYVELREPLGPGGERQAARLAPAVAREGALAQPTLPGGGCFRASLSTTSPASPGCRLAGVLVPNRMLAPCRCCPRYTSCWLFTAPLLGDRLVFTLVIWQRRSGADESGAGRSCFATFPLPHWGGFPKTAFPCAVPAACPGGAGLRDMGSDPCDG